MARMTKEEANKTIPCPARLNANREGTAAAIHCTRPLGHTGKHEDQNDGHPIQWESEELQEIN